MADFGGGFDSERPGAGGALGSTKGGSTKAGGGSTGNSGGGPKILKTPGDKKKLKGIPPVQDIPDSDGGALPSEPVDLSLLSGPQDLPQRKPLRTISVAVPQTGVTGYAGVFIP